jgi:hypothetical protein
MGIFQIFHAVDRHISDQSTVGRSRVDREADEWREMFILHWQWVALGLLVLAGLLGCGYWLLFF